MLPFQLLLQSSIQSSDAITYLLTPSFYLPHLSPPLAINIINKMNSQVLHKTLPIENPEDEPHSSLKDSHLSQTSTATLAPPNRLKFKYTVIEKPHQSWTGGCAILGWISLVAILFFVGYTEKMEGLRLQTQAQMRQCRLDYEKNKCQKGLKATVKFCEEKKKCYEADFLSLLNSKIDIGFMLGEIVKDLSEGAGIYICGAGLILMIALIRRPTAREVRKQYLQYCH